jgi:hypothetical protein
MNIDTILNTLSDLRNIDTLPDAHRDALWCAQLTLATLARKNGLKGGDDEALLFEKAKS